MLERDARGKKVGSAVSGAVFFVVEALKTVTFRQLKGQARNITPIWPWHGDISSVKVKCNPVES